MTRARPRRGCCAALAGLPAAARHPGRVALRADAGYFAGQLARAAHDAHIALAIGAKRIAPLWRLLAGIAEDHWHDATEMDNAQVLYYRTNQRACPGQAHCHAGRDMDIR